MQSLGSRDDGAGRGQLTRAAVEVVGNVRRLAARRGPVAGNMTSLVAAVLGTSRGVAAGLFYS